jgi:hypothetical protein
VPVTLAARMTAIGTLELFCVAKEGSNRWKLEFNIRELVKESAPRSEEEVDSAGITEVWVETQVQEAGRLIRAAYLGGEPAVTPQELTRSLEAALEATRHEWPMGLCRRLWDFLLEVAEQRRRTPAHLTRWYNLVGHCLRPGFGDPLDKFRIEQAWKLLAAPQRAPGPAVAATRIVEGGADYWVLFRRIAGGLNGALQHALFDRMRPILLPVKGRQIIRPNPNELAEMWRAAASLERLDVHHKRALADALLKPVQRSPVPPYAFWALTRLGARALIYGPMNTVVHPQVAEGWLDAILGFQPGNDNERLAWAFCLAQLARRTGQRALDVNEGHQLRVGSVLRGLGVPEHWVKMVEEVSELQREEQAQMLGDALPIGLRLAVVQE